MPIRSISIDELDQLGLDEHNNLYWRNQPVVTERRVTLPLVVNIAIIATGVGTMVMAVVMLLRYLDWSP